MPKIRTSIIGKSTMFKIKFSRSQVEQHSDTEQGEYSNDGFGFYWIFFTYREGNCYSHNEEKPWKYKISGGESIPLGMIEEPRRGGSLVVDDDHADHSQAPEDIEGVESLSFGLGLGVVRLWIIGWVDELGGEADIRMENGVLGFVGL